jgi:hypothetical protein
MRAHDRRTARGIEREARVKHVRDARAHRRADRGRAMLGYETSSTTDAPANAASSEAGSL